MRKSLPRKLHRGHFAFMRALAQGLDERASWDRYLRLEGEHTDLRGVRRTITWIRDEFAAAARRENRPGMARLILLDADRFDAATALPTLSEFAESRGMEDFSEAEQVEAYRAAYPDSGTAAHRRTPRPSRRTRVVERQLEALRWLESLVAQAPSAGDSVFAWLHPALAQHLVRADLPTLTSLVAHINRHGARWWQHVEGIGRLKSLRIIDWLQANEDSLGLRVGVHATVPRRALAPAVLDAVVPAGTALLPFEKFIVPAALDGTAGANRASPLRCTISAENDYEAIRAWLVAKSSAAGAMSSTRRAYRKEAERLLLWAVLEHGTAFSSLSCEDLTAFRHFLAHPPDAWCGPRHCQRWSSMWRPLEGPLSPAALQHCMTVLRSLFAFLVDGGYLSGNPLRIAVGTPQSVARPIAGRSLNRAQWSMVESLLAVHNANQTQRRLARAIRWIQATGLRISEIAAARCGDLVLIDSSGDDGIADERWMLTVPGHGGKRRQVAVPARLLSEVGDELERHGFKRAPGAVTNARIAILARFDAARSDPEDWSASGLHKAIKRFMVLAADRHEGEAAEELRRASAHWLRHARVDSAPKADLKSATSSCEGAWHHLEHVPGDATQP